MNGSRNFNRGERPEWFGETIEPVLTEWMLYDSDTKKLRFGKAENQKEAIKMALERNIIPRVTEDVRPRRGKLEDEIMSPEDFETFIQQLKK